MEERSNDGRMLIEKIKAYPFTSLAVIINFIISLFILFNLKYFLDPSDSLSFTYASVVISVVFLSGLFLDVVYKIIFKRIKDLRVGGTLLGSLWGFFSFWLVPRNLSHGTFIEFYIQRIPDIIQVPISLPSYISISLISLLFEDASGTIMAPALGVLAWFLSILIGSLIGFKISKIYQEER